MVKRLRYPNFQCYTDASRPDNAEGAVKYRSPAAITGICGKKNSIKQNGECYARLLPQHKQQE